MMRAKASLVAGLRAFVADETAATAIEYAIIASMISIVILGTVTAIGTALHDSFYNKIVAAFQ